MSRFWNPIKTIVMERGCLEAFKLNPGASKEELFALEKHIGFQLPSALREFLAIHNGQDSGFGLFFGLQFLSTNGIRSNWDAWRSIEGDDLNKELQDSMSSTPEGFIKPLYLNRNWIPLTHDLSGNHIGIDYDPDIKGTLGQIITFGRDDDQKKLKAKTFEEFLSLFVQQLCSVEWKVTANGWQISAPYDRHYHDWQGL
jgi:cell wall assembly regulator SMI1